MLDAASLPLVDPLPGGASGLLAPWWPSQDDEMGQPSNPERPPRLALALANDQQTDWCQRLVTAQHYLHAPVDPRCNVLAYMVLLGSHRIGCLIFGRPEATRVGGWYGDPEEKLAGRCRLSRWEILNLARIYIEPIAQDGGAWCRPGLVPGFHDRSGCWHSCLTTTVIRMAIECVLVDYLLCFAPVFLDQPYAIAEVLSYCDQAQPGHRGVIYEAAGFHLVRTNEHGIRTYAIPVRPLTQGEDAYVRYVATHALRSRRLRAQVASQQIAQQIALF